MNVTTEKHPELVAIMAFIDAPDAENEALELHLASCAACRHKTAELSQLQSNLNSAGFIREHVTQALKNKHQASAVFDEQQLEYYLNHDADSHQREDFNKQLQNDPQSLKAALHFASHQSAMNRELTAGDSKNNNQTTKAPSKKTTLSSMIKKYLTLPTPVWLMIPASGFASVLVFIALTTQLTTTENNMTIASYQDNAVLEYRNKTAQPGIGFFSNAGKKIVNFENVIISMSDNSTLKLSWPKINAASSYTVRLNKITATGSMPLAQKTVNTNTINFDNIKLDKQRRYQWILSGATSDNERFYATGGFVSH